MSKPDERFPLDETPMMHAFSGRPESCFDLVNRYGTYEVQRTADTDNVFPAIAQGMPKGGYYARCTKKMYDLTAKPKKPGARAKRGS